MTLKPNPIVVNYTRAVPIVDADDQPIFEGSVLYEVARPDNRGVVTWIGRAGQQPGPFMSTYGDLAIQTSSSAHQITNRYAAWRHIPPQDQTFKERLSSWITSTAHDPYKDRAAPEERAINGIAALAALDNADSTPRPDTVESALALLADYLDGMRTARLHSAPIPGPTALPTNDKAGLPPVMEGWPV